jgi:hypothetical protein
MVGKARTRLGALALRLAVRVTEDTVTYTPEQLNELIEVITAREVAGRLRERAQWHREQAESLYRLVRAVPGTTTLPVAERAGWHEREAETLERLAAQEPGNVRGGAA